MKPKTLSATSVQNYEECPARWTAEQFAKAGSPSGNAASLGTAVHSTLEWFVLCILEGLPMPTKLELDLHFMNTAPGCGVDPYQFKEGREMLERWYDRMDWQGREILSAEVKQAFQLKVPSHGIEIPFTFILDRLDKVENDDGSYDLEVVDYKTGVWNVTPDDVRKKIQARCYSAAVRSLYPDVNRIWVSFDMLRHRGPVGVSFSLQDDIKTIRYLQDVAGRILNDDGQNPQEKLNSTCRFCIRKSVCKALTKHVGSAGILSITDPDEAIARRMELDHAVKGLSVLKDELDQLILEWCEHNETTEFETSSGFVTVSSSKSRKIDPHKAGKIVGPDLMNKYGKIGITEIDKMEKAGEITPAQKAELDEATSISDAQPKIRVNPKGVIQ